MQSAQTLLFLLIYSSWARDASVVVEGFELYSPLVQYMQASGFAEYDSTMEQSWIEWSLYESERRTKFLSFCFLNIHTLIYNRPPSLLAREIQLRLPCSTKEWEITNELDWAASRQAYICNIISFQDALERLVDPKAVNRETLPCPFSNLILLHGVLQRIYLLRQLSFGHNLSDHEIENIQYVGANNDASLTIYKHELESKYLSINSITVQHSPNGLEFGSAHQGQIYTPAANMDPFLSPLLLSSL